ncbi:MAG: ornithine cyclodeaminase family protein [Thermodesulfobacteriota bacterium]|nr:ornithine cyclodeaminase family protein [Thermodesulfobacteriota bacterium]
MLILSKRDMESLLTMEEVLDALEAGFREVKEGRYNIPVRSHLTVKEFEGDFLFMPAFLPGLKLFGTKVVSVFPQNPSKGKPTIFASYLLNDPTTGELLALMEASTLTGIRTGGTSGLATRYLAREDAKVIGVIGTGFQASYQVKAIRAVRLIAEVWAYDVDFRKLEEFCDHMDSMVSVHAAKNASEVVRHADILVTVTTSKTPVFSGKDLKPGTHINAVGAFRCDMREVDEETVMRATIVVDTFEGCMAEAGDLLIPIREGKLKEDSIHSDLGDLVTGKKKGRKSSEEITLFKSVGFAMEDLVVAQRAYQKAMEKSQGQWVEMFSSP